MKLRVTGVDRQRFLNGQITNDVRKATGSNSIEACLLDAKGRLTAHIFLFAMADSLLIDGDPALKETLQARLERYVIADDVVVEDESERLSILHVIAPTAPSLAGAKWIVAARRFEQPGWDVWLDKVDREKAVSQLSNDFRFCDEDCAEVARIEQGIPRWGCELTNEIIPVEANLEGRCIDYEKGCYLGQEVISRMKMAGQRNKQLCGLVAGENAPLAAGTRLVSPAQKDKEVGWITSATNRSQLGHGIALGFVKRGFNMPGTKLETALPATGGRGPVQVEVVDLPFGQ